MTDAIQSAAGMCITCIVHQKACDHAHHSVPVCGLRGGGGGPGVQAWRQRRCRWARSPGCPASQPRLRSWLPARSATWPSRPSAPSSPASSRRPSRRAPRFQLTVCEWCLLIAFGSGIPAMSAIKSSLLLRLSRRAPPLRCPRGLCGRTRIPVEEDQVACVQSLAQNAVVAQGSCELMVAFGCKACLATDDSMHW